MVVVERNGYNSSLNVSVNTGLILMKKVINQFLVLVVIAGIFAMPVYAVSPELEKARTNISKLFENINSNDIQDSPIPGVYQVSMPPRIYYVSANGRYVINGDLFDAVANKNLSQGVRNKSTAEAINAVKEDSMISFGKKGFKHTITVFTDIDCGYCRKLHHEVKKYNELGIRVRYLAYPRAGIGSASFKKAEAVWCSKDKAKAMTEAKNGKTLSNEKCANPVQAHFELGNALGVRGTPAIILENGELIPGYSPAAQLLQTINKSIN